MNAARWSDLPLVLTSDQAAIVLQIKRRTVTNMLDRGDLHGLKIGNEWRISRAELARFVENASAQTWRGTAASTDGLPPLAEKGGILVVQAEPLVDLAGFVAQEHERRIDALIQQADL